jgi:hypothetical protein
MKPGLPRASWNGLTLLEGLQPPAEQKEVSRAESLLLAEEWQEFSDPDSLRKQEQDKLVADMVLSSLTCSPDVPKACDVHTCDMRG